MKGYRVLMMVHRQQDNSPYCFYVHEQAKALRNEGHDVTVISCVGLPPFADRLRPEVAELNRRTPEHAVVDGIQVYYPRCLTLGNPGERLFGGWPIARAAMKTAQRLHAEKRFDLVHAHMLPRDGHAGLLIAGKLGIPCALTIHGTDVFHYFIPGQKPWPRNIRIARDVDALMSVSSLLLSRVAPYRTSGMSEIVQNGVDLSLIPEKTERKRHSILSVGTLKERKCMDRTLEAFGRIAGDIPDAELTLVGIGPMEGRLRQRAAELGLSDRVHLTGGLPHREVLEIMSRSDLFVLPSWGEGYGIVYIEAMAAGCIAVGAEGEGIADTIVHGENGFLVPAGDTEAVEHVMRDVFACEEKYALLRENGRQTARKLTWQRNARQTGEVYTRMLRQKEDENEQKGL